MRDALGKRLLIGSGVLAVLVGLLFGFMLIAISELRDSGQSARESQEILAAANGLQARTLSLETSARGFVITRQEPFLDPWRHDVAAFPAQAAALERLSRGHPDVRRVERAIAANLRSYVSHYAAPLIEQARTDPAGAEATVRSGEGKRRIDVMRAQFQALITMTTALSDHHQARADSTGRLAIAAGIAGIAGAVLLIMAFGVYLARTIVTPVREIAAAAEQLARRVDINRALLDASVDGICLLDMEGRPLLANSVIERFETELFGIAKGATPRESLAIAARLLDPAAYLATMQAILDDPECATQDVFELAGPRRAFERHTGPVRDSAGELIGRIIVIREITAEREAARLKTELVATVSHELRTPLTGVLGFVELLLHHDLDEATSRRYLTTIHSEARRLTGLVDDFLDVQKLEAGSFTLALEAFDLGEVLGRKIELFSAQSARHQLELELPDGSLGVIGDSDRIGQVIANLLSNAIKYSPAGGSVTITATSRDHVARVCIGDAGIGIPASQQAQVFTRFFRVDSSDTREIGGTGLGLSLSREIVTAHGGQIGFESSEGAGSTFWFELPSARRADDERVRRLVAAPGT